MTFGSTPTGAINGNFIEMPIVTRYDTWWTLKLTDVKMAGNSIKKSGGNYAIIDTGTSLLYMLETDYSYFVTMVQAASPDFICNSPLYDYCYSNQNTCSAYDLENLTIFLNYNEYVITPAGYTLSNGDLDGHACSIAVSYSADSQGLYILGDTFLRNFVSTYDYKKKAVRLAVSSYAPPGTSAVAHDNPMEIIFIAVGALIGLIVLFCICKNCCFKKKKNKSSVDKDRLTDLSVNMDV